jgi:hypothetical protein
VSPGQESSWVRLCALEGDLHTSSFGKKTLVNFDWRLDYRVRSSGAGENLPVFLCKFRLIGNDGVEVEEEIECNASAMKDMLFKVTQASEQMR